MGGAGRIKTMALSAMVLVAGLFFHSQAYAVAGKTVPVNVGTSLAGATLEFEMNEGPPVTVQVDPQGQAEIPEDVNQRTVRACYRKEQSAAGETKRRIDCAGWLPTGGAMATLGSLASSMGGWGIDAMVAGGYSFGATKSGSQTQASGFANATTGSNPAGRLGSGTFSFTLRFIAPVEGPFKTRYWAYVGADKYADASGTGGDARNHFGSSTDTQNTRKVNHAFKFGVGVDMPIHCPEGGWGKGCSYIGLRVGGAAVEQTSTVTSDESSGGGGLVRGGRRQTDVVPNVGVWAATPMPGTPFDVVVGFDAMYLTSIESQARSPFGFGYVGRNDRMWYLTPWGGIKYTF